MMKFILITADPELGQRAERAGVGRIMVDLERIGKFERQKCRDTWISKHELSDIAPMAAKLCTAELMVRINPLHTGSQAEIDEAIAQGTDLIMLPMFHALSEITDVSGMIGGRCGFVPLVETAASLEICGEVAAVDEVTEIFIGLNDLHLSLGLDFMFEPLANGLLDKACENLRKVGKPFGFGGIARIGEGDLPAELILREHARLGSSRVILSRTFARSNSVGAIRKDQGVLRSEVAKLLDVYDHALQFGPEAAEQTQQLVRQHIAEIIAAGMSDES